MDKTKLKKVFKFIEEEVNLDYAIVNTDEYGDCSTCVCNELERLYGIDSKGIFAKHWSKGINRGGSFKSLDSLAISHDITEEQFKVMKKIFQEQGYSILPEDYIPTLVIYIKEKR